jgi:hypothetical protein
VSRAALSLLLCLPSLIAAASQVSAQALPPPSRSVFKCDQGGKTVYSDTPCLGAQRIEVEPTRGVSKLSGKERIGADVQHEHFRELMSDAIRPLSGMDRKQYATFEHRYRLNPEAQQECRRLDTHLPPLERQELQTSGADLAAVQQQLFTLRKRFRELGC